jgi:predicted nuclease of restriction endonuclease-like (RecB) superfamily
METERQNRSKPGRPDGSPPADYRALLTDVKARIRASQIRTSLSVNRELIQLYWDIGRLIVHRQQTQGWGAGVINRLASDLNKAFPGLEGFSASNISRMRAFFLAYAPRYESPPPAMASIPWGHNIALLFKLGSSAARLWHAQQATANGWSRSLLEHWIYSDLYSRQGKAMTNFKAALPRPQSDLANEIVRDPDDKLSIGLILCKTRSTVIAEYALRNLVTPVGVARYTTKLAESLPVELKDSLPSPKAIQAELQSRGPEAQPSCG